MDMKILNTAYTQLLKKSVDVYDRQHEAIAQNVANTNNENYRRVNTDFSSDLRIAVENSRVRTTREKHIQHASNTGSANSTANPTEEERVDLAREMTDMSVNQIRHEFVTRALARHYSGISKAIIGRNA